MHPPRRPWATVPLMLAGVALAAVLAGCGEETADAGATGPSGGPTTETTTETGASLCDLVEPGLNPGYGLRVDGESTGADARSCRFASEDGRTTLTVETRAVPGDRLEEELRRTCRELGLRERPDEGHPPGKRCFSDTEGQVGADQVLAATLLEEAAILVATLRSEDEAVAATAPAELAMVEFAVATG